LALGLPFAGFDGLGFSARAGPGRTLAYAGAMRPEIRAPPFVASVALSGAAAACRPTRQSIALASRTPVRQRAGINVKAVEGRPGLVAGRGRGLWAERNLDVEVSATS
jgi:hypothetical protein